MNAQNKQALAEWQAKVEAEATFPGFWIGYANRKATMVIFVGYN
jgi:hypothetical protein